MMEQLLDGSQAALKIQLKKISREMEGSVVLALQLTVIRMKLHVLVAQGYFTITKN